MDALHRLAETRLEEAVREGAFDGLPDAGRPLELPDLSRVPADLRPAYLLLRGAGVIPPELELRREVLRLEDLLAACTREDEAAPVRRDLRMARLRAALAFEALRERRARP